MATTGAWVDAFIDELKSAGVKGYTLDAAKCETISKLAYDPWKAPTPVASADPLAAAGAAPKRPRFEDGSAPRQAPPGQLIGEQAAQKVKDMVSAGKWVEVTMDSRRENSGAYADRPPRIFIMKFIIDGTERSTYDWKPTIVEAGYTHYSGNDRAGWVPFTLPGGKKGQGKELKDQAELEQYWEVKAFNTAKLNDEGDAYIFRGQSFSVASGATEWGPRGPQGPKWGSAWCGD